MNMFDSHAHIGDISFQDGLVCSSSPDEIPVGYKYRAIGLLPGCKSSNLESIEIHAQDGYMIGEIGLDKRYGDIDKQILLFKACLSIAKKYNRFISIHMVGYSNLLYTTLKDMKVDNFLIHNYTGSVEMAKAFISLGGLISLSPRARRSKAFKSLLALPFVTETDMMMSEKEQSVLSSWNNELSLYLDKDIANISQSLLLERLD